MFQHYFSLSLFLLDSLQASRILLTKYISYYKENCQNNNYRRANNIFPNSMTAVYGMRLPSANRRSLVFSILWLDRSLPVVRWPFSMYKNAFIQIIIDSIH